MINNIWHILLQTDRMILFRAVSAVFVTFTAVYDDLKRYKISNRLMAVGLCVGIAFILLEAIEERAYMEYILGGSVTFVVMFLIYIVRGVGAGDVKLLTVLGFLTGLQIIKYVVFNAFLITGAVGIIYVLTDRGKKIVVETPTGHRFKMHAIHFSVAVLVGEVIMLCTYWGKGGVYL